MSAANAIDNLLIEILAPSRIGGGETVVCDCCRRRRNTAEFDADAFGICSECLISDTILFEFETLVAEHACKQAERTFPRPAYSARHKAKQSASRLDRLPGK
jgi:hypothetical protein